MYRRKSRQIVVQMAEDRLDLIFNWERRLRNALIALSQMDCQWMVWVEREISKRWSIERTTHLVEARARGLVLKRYPRLCTSEMIFGNLPFNDDGNLMSG